MRPLTAGSRAAVQSISRHLASQPAASGSQLLNLTSSVTARPRRWSAARRVPISSTAGQFSLRDVHCRCYATGPSPATDSLRVLLKDLSPEDRQRGLTLRQILVQQHGKDIAERYYAAIPVPVDGQTAKFALAMHDVCPPEVHELHYLDMHSIHGGARSAYWLTAAYLLGAALSSHKIQGRSVLMAGRPRLLEDSAAGGLGFSYECMLGAPEGSSTSNAPTTHTEALQAVEQLVTSDQNQPVALTAEDLQAIDRQVARFVARKHRVDVSTIPKEEALELFKANPFKSEAILAQSGDSVSIVRIGSYDGTNMQYIYTDLAPIAPTPLLADVRSIRAFRSLDWSAATFTSSDPSVTTPDVFSSAQHLQNIRAIAFPDKEFLKEHLQATEAASKSSHQLIGKAQSLFLAHPSSPGSPFFLPSGVRLAKKMERVIRDLYDVHGYEEVMTPQMYKADLWKKSGHWDNYRADMFGVEGFTEQEARQAELVADVLAGRDGCCAAHSSAESAESSSSRSSSSSAFGLKPMNCPGHCLIFASQPRTLKDLPIRFAEWSPLHRNEASGALSGLTRVRRFHQDDAHVFCAPEQVKGEIATMLDMLASAYDLFGFPRFELVLSTRPPDFIGSIEEWDRAEANLREALDGTGMDWKLNSGDGAFYGPKIDVRLFDAQGRKHQTATIQLDFQLPQRFDLTYDDGSSGVGAGKQAQVEGDETGPARPVMIHRAILGSVERFMAILIDSRSGDWPFWMSPKQCCVLPAVHTEEVLQYARRVARQLSLGQDDGVGAGAGAAITNTASSPPPIRPRPTHKFHVDVDASEDRLGRRLKRAQVDGKYSFIVVVGQKEVDEAAASHFDSSSPRLPLQVRMRGAGELENMQRKDPSWWRRAQAANLMKGDATHPAVQAEMGTWTVEELRSLFIKMDGYHL